MLKVRSSVCLFFAADLKLDFLKANGQVERGTGEMEGQSSKSFNADGTFAAGVLPSVLPERSPAPEPNKKHGFWCKVRGLMPKFLKRS